MEKDDAPKRVAAEKRKWAVTHYTHSGKPDLARAAQITALQVARTSSSSSVSGTALAALREGGGGGGGHDGSNRLLAGPSSTTASMTPFNGAGSSGSGRGSAGGDVAAAHRARLLDSPGLARSQQLSTLAQGTLLSLTLPSLPTTEQDDENTAGFARLQLEARLRATMAEFAAAHGGNAFGGDNWGVPDNPTQSRYLTSGQQLDVAAEGPCVGPGGDEVGGEEASSSSSSSSSVAQLFVPLPPPLSAAGMRAATSIAGGGDGKGDGSDSSARAGGGGAAHGVSAKLDRATLRAVVLGHGNDRSGLGGDRLVDDMANDDNDWSHIDAAAIAGHPGRRDPGSGAVMAGRVVGQRLRELAAGTSKVASHGGTSASEIAAIEAVKVAMAGAGLRNIREMATAAARGKFQGGGDVAPSTSSSDTHGHEEGWGASGPSPALRAARRTYAEAREEYSRAADADEGGEGGLQPLPGERTSASATPAPLLRPRILPAYLRAAEDAEYQTPLSTTTMIAAGQFSSQLQLQPPQCQPQQLLTVREPPGQAAVRLASAASALAAARSSTSSTSTLLSSSSTITSLATSHHPQAGAGGEGGGVVLRATVGSTSVLTAAAERALERDRAVRDASVAGQRVAILGDRVAAVNAAAQMTAYGAMLKPVMEGMTRVALHLTAADAVAREVANVERAAGAIAESRKDRLTELKQRRAGVVTGAAAAAAVTASESTATAPRRLGIPLSSTSSSLGSIIATVRSTESGADIGSRGSSGGRLGHAGPSTPGGTPLTPSTSISSTRNLAIAIPAFNTSSAAKTATGKPEVVSSKATGCVSVPASARPPVSSRGSRPPLARLAVPAAAAESLSTSSARPPNLSTTGEARGVSSRGLAVQPSPRDCAPVLSSSASKNSSAPREAASRQGLPVHSAGCPAIAVAAGRGATPVGARASSTPAGATIVHHGRGNDVTAAASASIRGRGSGGPPSSRESTRSTDSGGGAVGGGGGLGVVASLRLAQAKLQAEAARRRGLASAGTGGNS